MKDLIEQGIIKYEKKYFIRFKNNYLKLKKMQSNTPSENKEQ